MTQRETECMEKAKTILEKVDLLLEKLSIELDEYKKIDKNGRCDNYCERRWNG